VNILVTGGAGYIGSIVAQELLTAGHTVIVYDNLSRGNRRAVPAGAIFVHGDISDRDKLDHLFSHFAFDAVMHFAAFTEAGESRTAPEIYFRNNAVHTLTLLEAMCAAGVKRFVFSSTGAVYGEPKLVPIKENDLMLPTNPYGESKAMVERMLEWFSRIHGLHYASLRYFNAAGSAGELGEAHQPESHLIPLVLQVALGTRENISIFGSDYHTSDGSCIRDYIHVRDLAKAHMLCLEALAFHDRLIYNLGTNRGYSVREVIAVARKITGHSIPAIECARRPGDPAVLIASAKKIQRDLEWEPMHSELAEIIESTWSWMKAHPAGYPAESHERSHANPE
jgi:UDP-glucose 4-epimerase